MTPDEQMPPLALGVMLGVVGTLVVAVIGRLLMNACS